MTEWNVISLQNEERNILIAAVNLYGRAVKAQEKAVELQEKTLALEEKKWELFLEDRETAATDKKPYTVESSNPDGEKPDDEKPAGDKEE